MEAAEGDVRASRSVSDAVMPDYVDWIPSGLSEELSAFRRRVFKENYGARVNVDKLGWNHNDDVFPSLGVFDSAGKIVSCLRLAPIPTPSEFERILLLPYREAYSSLPLLVVGRSATDAGMARRGLHAMLRLLSLRIAIELEFSSHVSSVAQGDPRLGLFREMGCEIYQYDKNWTGFLPSEQPPLLVVLKGHDRMVAGSRALEDRLKTRRPLELRCDLRSVVRL